MQQHEKLGKVDTKQRKRTYQRNVSTKTSSDLIAIISTIVLVQEQKCGSAHHITFAQGKQVFVKVSDSGSTERRKRVAIPLS